MDEIKKYIDILENDEEYSNEEVMLATKIGSLFYDNLGIEVDFEVLLNIAKEILEKKYGNVKELV